MYSAPSVAYEGSGATDGAVLAGAAEGAVEGAAADGAADDGLAELVPPLHAAMNAAMLVKPVAARNLRRVMLFADTRRTIASSS